MNKMTAGCGNCSGIITGGKLKRRFQPSLKKRRYQSSLNKRRFQTLKKPVIGKRTPTRRYVNARGGCPCNQNGGYTYPNKTSTRTNGGALQISGLSSSNLPFGKVYI